MTDDVPRVTVVSGGRFSIDGGTMFGVVPSALRLSLNDALSHGLRKPAEHPTTLQRALADMRLLTVRVEGRRGVLEAEVSVADDEGRIVARRTIGARTLTGCRGPDAVDIALRAAGSYRTTVRFSDGKSSSPKVVFDHSQRISITIVHPDEKGTVSR